MRAKRVPIRVVQLSLLVGVYTRLLEDPLSSVVDVLDGALREPAGRNTSDETRPRAWDPENVQFDLLLSVLHGVGTVADVATDSECEVTPDGSCSSRSFSRPIRTLAARVN